MSARGPSPTSYAGSSPRSSGIVDRREAYFREQGIDSIETYRSRRAAGRADDGYGDVFLVIDGWGTLRAEFDDLELEIQQLAGRGLTFGLHLLVGATRWADFRAAMRDMLGSRLELRLGDPLDSEIDRKVAALVPGRAAGSRSGAGQAALPRRAAAHRRDARPRGPRRRRRRPDRSQSRRPGTVRPVRSCGCCPSSSRWTTIREDAVRRDRAGKQLILGINEKELAPATLDTEGEPHLLIFGDGQSGKSALLRNYVQEIMRTRTPKEAQIVVVDYRRSLLGEVPDEYLLNYLTCATQATPVMQGDRGVPREPDPRPRRHARAAAQPLLVDRRRGLRGRRRLRPRRDPAGLAGAGAAAADGAGPRHRPARRGRPSRRWRVAGALRAGHPVDARPGDARHHALRQPATRVR